MSAPRSPTVALRLFTVLFFLAGLAGVAGAVYELGLARRAWASLKVARGQLLAEQNRSQGPDRAAAADRPEGGDGRTAEATAPEDRAKAAAPADGSKSSWDPRMEAQLFLNANPHIRDLLEGYAKSQFQMIFGPYLRTANLTPSQLDQLEAAISQNWLGNLTLGPKGQLNASSLLPPAAQLQPIVGEQGAQQLQDYVRALPAQTVANRIASANGYAGTPLTADQTGQLTQIIANDSTAYQEGKSASPNSVNWPAAEAQANAVLSPAQAAAAGNVFSHLEYQQALEAARAAARAAAGK